MFGIICILCIVLNILTNVQGNYVNVAHGKTAYTNTNIPANNVLDGSKDSCTTIDTGDDNTPASLTIDLGEFYNIFQVKVYNTYNITEYRFLGHFDIYGGTNENRMVMCASCYDDIYNGAMKSLSCIHDSVKYITIRKHNRTIYGSTFPSRMTICEVTVVGVPNNTNSNVALGKTAYTNTNISADNVLDGLTGRNDPCTTIDTGDLNIPASITVDLGDLYNIFQVKVYNTYNEAEAYLLGEYRLYCGHTYCMSRRSSIPTGGNVTHTGFCDSVKDVTIRKQFNAYRVSSRMTICEIKVIGLLNSANTNIATQATTEFPLSPTQTMNNSQHPTSDYPLSPTQTKNNSQYPTSASDYPLSPKQTKNNSQYPTSDNNHTVLVVAIVSTLIIVLIIALVVASYYILVLRRRSDDTSPLLAIWDSQGIDKSQVM